MYAQSSSIATASSLWCELSDQVQCVYCTELPEIIIIVLHNTYRNSSLQQLLHSPGSELCTALAVQTTIDYSRAAVMHNPPEASAPWCLVVTAAATINNQETVILVRSIIIATGTLDRLIIGLVTND